MNICQRQAAFLCNFFDHAPCFRRIVIIGNDYPDSPVRVKIDPREGAERFRDMKAAKGANAYIDVYFHSTLLFEEGDPETG